MPNRLPLITISRKPAVPMTIAASAKCPGTLVLLAKIIRSTLLKAHGLRMRLGMGRPRRSFRKLCQEAGIPAWMRERLPVLWIGGEAAWIGGIGVAADFACEAGGAGLVPEWRPGGESR